MEDRKALFNQKITVNSDQFTSSDKKIADFLLRDYPHCLLKNATEVAAQVNVNVSTVTRFFKKIGYKNIREAHMEFREDADFIFSSPADRIKGKDSLNQNCFTEMVELDIRNIQNTFNGLERGQVKQLIDLLGLDTPRIFFTAERSKPYSLAYYLYVQLRLIRSGVEMLDTDGSLITHALAEACDKDLMLVFDFRRYCNMNREVVQAFKRIGGKVVVFTDSPLSPNHKSADLTFFIDTKSTSMFDSYTAGLTLMNLIVAKLADSLPEEISSKYERLEQLYSDLDTFTG